MEIIAEATAISEILINSEYEFLYQRGYKCKARPKSKSHGFYQNRFGHDIMSDHIEESNSI